MPRRKGRCNESECNNASRTFAAAVLMALLSTIGCAAASSRDSPVVRVGSKAFTESFILGELIAQIIEDEGEAAVERQLGLGGAAIAFRALSSGEIDVYPEYTGTLTHAILRDPAVVGVTELRLRLRNMGLSQSVIRWDSRIRMRWRCIARRPILSASRRFPTSKGIPSSGRRSAPGTSIAPMDGRAYNGATHSISRTSE